MDLKFVGHALQTAEASHGLAMLNLNLLFGGDLVVLGLGVRSAALIFVIVGLVALAIDIQLMTIGAAHSVLVVKIRPLFSLEVRACLRWCDCRVSLTILDGGLTRQSQRC